MTNVLQKQFWYCFTWNSNQIPNLNIFSFLFIQTVLLINSISLCFSNWIFCQHSLNNWPNLFPSFWLFLVLFWMLWTLVTAHKSCHVPHTSQITTWGTIFRDFLMCPRNESDLGHMLSWKLVIKHWLKSFWQSVQKRWWEGKMKKTRMAIAKLLH